MYLRTPRWADALLASKSSPDSSSPVEDLVHSLIHRRLYREVRLALRTCLREAKAEFSFMRVKGLKKLLSFLSLLPESEKMMELFRQSQSDVELQVVPTLFQYSLASFGSPLASHAGSITSRESTEMMSPPNDREIALALRVLEGCCLIDSRSKIMASQYSNIKEIIELLSSGGALEQFACLDVLLALMLDVPMNQKEFVRYHGLEKIAHVMRNKHPDENLRLKCAEFLVILSGKILPPNLVEGDNVQSSEQTAERAQQEIVEYLGKECVAVLNKASLLEPSLFEVKEHQMLLHSHAKELLQSIDLGTHLKYLYS